MRYLVDAYNLLFRTLKKRGSLEKSRQLMIAELNEVASRLKLQITLVFDGADEHQPLASRGHFDSIELMYTPREKTADECILEEVSNSKNPSGLTVVSNDRELTGRCKQRGAHKMTIDTFITLVTKKQSQKRSSPTRRFRESTAEFERLLKIFESRMQDREDAL